MAFNQSFYNFSITTLTQTSTTISPTNATSIPGIANPFSESAKIFGYIFYGLVFVSGICGNSVVFYVIGYRKQNRTSSDVFILSLACADFLSSVFVPLVMLSDLVTNLVGWIYGPIGCQTLPVVSPATICASAWSLVLISLDRYRIIAKPMGRRPSSWALAAAVLIIWTCSITITIPLVLRLRLDGQICWDSNTKIISNKNLVIFNGFLVVFIWVIPNLIIMVTYWKTGRALKRNTVQHANNLAVLKRNKENARVVKMFVTIIITFFILTIPYGCYYFSLSYVLCFYNPKQLNFKTLITLNYVLFIPAAANGCINPLVYAKLHKDVNKFLKVAARRFCRFVAGFVYKPGSKGMYEVSSAWSVQTNSTIKSST